MPNVEETSKEIATENQESSETTETAKTTETPEVTAEAEMTKTTETPEVAQTPKKKVEPPYISFFDQYLELVKAGNSTQAIKALDNCIKTMLKDGSNTAFNAVFKRFADNKQTLSVNKSLQSIALLSAANRAIVEVITTVYHVILTDISKPVDLEKVRTVVKVDNFVNWCSKKLTK